MDRETLSSRLKDKRGTVTITVVVLLIFLIMFAAFAIDVGYMLFRRNELQNIADTAALASMGELGSVYSTMTFPQALAYAPARDPLRAKAQEVVDATGVSGVSGASGVTINPADFQLGVWNPSTQTFTPQTIGPTAVRVIARKDGAANGPFSTLLAGVLGIGTFNVSTTATASLTAQYAAPPGTLPIPVGISYAWFLNNYCDQPIMLYPTNTPSGCAGWHNYTDDVNARALRDTLAGLNNETFISPQTTAGVTSYNFIGGNITPALRDLQTLFNTMKGKNDGVLDKDEDPDTWTTAVAVYNSNDCNNPNQPTVIVGFSTITITAIYDHPADNEVTQCGAAVNHPAMVICAKVVCDRISSGPGGNGLTLGTLGSIPNLVQ